MASIISRVATTTALFLFRLFFQHSIRYTSTTSMIPSLRNAPSEVSFCLSLTTFDRSQWMILKRLGLSRRTSPATCGAVWYVARPTSLFLHDIDGRSSHSRRATRQNEARTRTKDCIEHDTLCTCRLAHGVLWLCDFFFLGLWDCKQHTFALFIVP